MATPPSTAQWMVYRLNNIESDASRYRWRPFATFAEYAKYRDADSNNVYLNGGIYICKEVSQEPDIDQTDRQQSSRPA